MAGRFTVNADVIDRSNESLPEEVMPDSIDENSRR